MMAPLEEQPEIKEGGDWQFIDTHCHLDGKEFDEDRDEVIERARKAGVSRLFVPAIDYSSSMLSLECARSYPGYVYPMFGLHPEEVRADWREQLGKIKALGLSAQQHEGAEPRSARCSYVAIGEVGLDFYWSRELESEQLEAFEEQVRWSVEMRLPLMIHCRKAQNEMVKILRRYEPDLPGGVFHCFTGNAIEAAELLSFERFVLGIGGVLTFKKSPLPDMLPKHVPLGRIVLETDAPYMAPVPHRGKRNESAFVIEVLRRLATAYGLSEQEVACQTSENVNRVFGGLD